MIRATRRIEEEANTQIHVCLDVVQPSIRPEEVLPGGNIILNSKAFFWTDTKLVERREHTIDVHDEITIKDGIVLLDAQDFLCATEDAVHHLLPPTYGP